MAEGASELYNRTARDYGRVGPPFFQVAGRRLVELADVRRGLRVLDIACGRGAVLIPAAERVGMSGEAIGIDISAGMVEATAADLRSRGLSQARVHVMDAQSLELPASSFDAVLCSFAVFWFGDLDAVLDGVHRVLKPQGTIGFAFARGTDPRWQWYEQTLGRHGALERLPPHTGRQGIRDEGVLARVLSDSGFEKGSRSRGGRGLQLHGRARVVGVALDARLAHRARGTRAR